MILDADYLAAVERRCRQFQGTWDQGTSGSLAADAFRLLRERQRLMNTMEQLEQQNAALRAARDTRVAAAEAACCEGLPLCQTIDTRGPLVDPEQVIADDDEALDGECVSAMDPDTIEAAWAAVKARHAELHGGLTQPEPVVSGRVFGLEGPRPVPATAAEALLRQAIDVVRERSGTYGPPAEHFKITVGLLNAAFAAKFARRLEAGEPPFDVTDWPVVMMLDKIARSMGPRGTPDTAIDLAGYASTIPACQGA